MNNNTTIVISCAGMGTRLGAGTTKALIDILGKPLIIRQLECLKDYRDIIVVVGYQADKVIDVPLRVSVAPHRSGQILGFDPVARRTRRHG